MASLALALVGLPHLLEAASVFLTTTGNPTEMVVSWSELGNASSGDSRVRWGTSADALNRTVLSQPAVMQTWTEDLSTYDYCGDVFEVHTLHMVVLRGMPADAQIFYEADQVNSSLPPARASFRTPPLVPAPTLRFFATADVGDPVSHPWTAFPQMIARQAAAASASGAEEAFGLGIHAGDIAYNLDLPPNGDEYFVAGASPIGASIPWMVAAGNHEADCNYTYANYRGRFAAQNLTAAPTRAPNSNSSRWYSFEQGPVHFVALETDAYGFDEVAYALAPQYAWLEADLAAVDRAATPWVVLFGHRPMYCSSVTAASSARLGWPKQPDAMPRDAPPPANYGDGFGGAGVLPPPWRGGVGDVSSCGVADLLRNGMHAADGSGTRLYGLEPLMDKFGVDVYLTGHEVRRFAACGCCVRVMRAHAPPPARRPPPLARFSLPAQLRAVLADAQRHGDQILRPARQARSCRHGRGRGVFEGRVRRCRAVGCVPIE